MKPLKWIFCGVLGIIKWLVLMSVLIFALISTFLLKVSNCILDVKDPNS